MSILPPNSYFNKNISSIFLKATLLLLFIGIFTSASFAQGPVISYTPLTNTCDTGSRVLVATITDADGVPTSGLGLPVMYWQINNQPLQRVTAVSLGSNLFQFTFGVGSFTGSVISYFIVAQDNAATPNVTIYPSAVGASGITSSPPTVTTPPTYTDYYVVQSLLTTGTYLVGLGQDFTTISDAINAYNGSCLNGPITFLLTDTLYSTAESFPILISNPAASSINSLKIKPNTGVNTKIIGSSSEAIFKFNGADFITIDGSNAGTTTRNLTVNNTSTSLTSSVFWLASFNSTNGSTNNVIKNCIISGKSNSTTFSGIAISSGASISSIADAENANNSIINNSINTSYFGIFINGPATNDNGNIISGNLIGTTTQTDSVRKIGYRAIYISNENNIIIKSNTIAGVNSTVYTGSIADASGGIIISGFVNGGEVSQNLIYDIKNSSSAGAPSYGISLQASSDIANFKVNNNFIHTITSYGKSSNPLENSIGIAVISGGAYFIQFNSVHLGVNQITQGITSCILISSYAIGGIDIRNNIFSNRQSSGIKYAIYSQVPVSFFSFINYNDYYSSGFLGFLNENALGLLDWQAITLSDGGSITTDPIFVRASSATYSLIDLHLQNASPLNEQGIPITGLTKDYDNDTRNNTNPDIGADEFTPPACSGNASGGNAFLTTSAFLCASGQIVISCAGFSTGVGTVYQWQNTTDSVNLGWSNLSGETNPSNANSPIINQTTFYRLRVACGGGSAGYSNTIKIEVKNPSITNTVPASRCGNGTLTLTANADANTTIQWYAQPSAGLPLYSGNVFTTPVLTSSTTYYAQPTYIGSSGSCGPVSPIAQGGAINTQLTPWNVYFDVLQATTLYSVDVFPLSTGQSYTIELYSPSGALLNQMPFNSTVSGGATPQTVPLNFFMLPDNGYYLYIRTNVQEQLGAGLSRNSTNANYPYTSSDINITGNGFRQEYFMCFYNWKFYNGCSISRTPVVATIVQTATANATSSVSQICYGQNVNLIASSSNTNYVYTWSPGNYSGSNVPISPTQTTTYYLTAVDGPCVNNSNVTIVVNPKPASLTIAPKLITKCQGSTQQMVALGGEIAEVKIFSENFNNSSLSIPDGWELTSNPTSSIGKWTGQNNNYIYNFNRFSSNDSSRFFIANSDLSGGSIVTSLRTPSIKLSNYSSIMMTFWHTYSPYDGPESIAIERSSNPSVAGSWVTVWTKNNTTNPYGIGSTIAFKKDTVDLTSLTLATTGTTANKPDSVYLRFKYTANADFWWAIDNIEIKGNALPPITWSPPTGLYTNAAGTTAYTGVIEDTLYANPTVNTTYIATSTSPNGCFVKDTAVINVRPAVGVSLSSSPTTCAGTATNISIVTTGVAPWTCTLRRTIGAANYDTTFTITSSPAIIPVTPSATAIYSVISLIDANSCSSATSNKDTITVISAITAATIAKASTTTLCTNGTGSSIKVTITGGTSPFTLVYSALKVGTTVPVLTTITGYTSNLAIPINPTDTTRYAIVSITSASGCVYDSTKCQTGTCISNVTVNVIKVNVGILSPISTSVCTATNSSILRLTGYSGTIIWRKSLDTAIGSANTNWTAVTGTRDTLLVSNIATTTYYHAILTNGNCKDTTLNAVIKYGVGLDAGTINGAATVCSGTNSTTLTLTAYTGSIQWQSSTDNITFTNITGATSSNYTAVNLSVTKYYRVIVSSASCGTPVTGNAVAITVNSTGVNAGTISGATTVCSGTNSAIITITGSQGNIQWQSSSDNITFTDIVGENLSTYTATNLTSSRYYRIVVTNGTCGSATSSSALITVAQLPVAGTIGGTSSVCSGTNSAALTLTGYTGTIQWQSSTDNVTFSNISGATGATYTANNLASTTFFAASLSSTACSSTVTTSSYTVTLEQSPLSGTISGGATVCGTTNSTVLSTSGSVGNLQWQSSTDNVTYTNISGATGTSYTATNLSVTTYFKVVATNGSCGTSTSAFALITVAQLPVAGTISGPSSVCSGTNSAALTLTGYTGTIQWQSSTDNVTFTNISGATGATYTATNIIVTTYYRVNLSTSGCTAPATSSSYTVTLVQTPLSGTISGGATVCGTTNSTVLSTSGSVGNLQWQSSTDNVTYTNISGATGTSYTATNLSVTTYFKVVATNGSCGTSTSAFALITVAQLPVAGTISGPSSVCSGTNSAALTLTGYTGTIQWQSSTDNVTFTNISGATGATYTATNIIVTTYYRVNLSTSGCTAPATSSSYTVTLVQTPLSGTISGGATVCGTTNSTVLSTSGSVGNLQWQSSTDNVTYTNISGATGTSYTATNLSVTTYFKVVATNGSCGTSTSAFALITVAQLPVAGTISGPSSVCSGTNGAALTLTGYTGTIQWQSSTDNVTFTDISGATGSTYTATNIVVTTYYHAAITSVSCGITTSNNFPVVLKTRPTGVISGGATYCSPSTATSTTLSIVVTGEGPWSGTLSNGTLFTGNSSPISVNVPAPASNTSYTISSLSDANCIALSTDLSGSANIFVGPYTRTNWLGNSTNWNDPANWCGGFPDPLMSVRIDAGRNYYPVITDSNATVKSIEIAQGASLTILGGAKLKLFGNLLDSGILNNSGVLCVTGINSQVIAGNGIILTMDTLEVLKSGDSLLTISKSFAIKGLLRPYYGRILLNDTITITSNSNNTASIDRVGAVLTYGPFGKFIIERYIPLHNKAWQLLSTPTFGQTVKQAWQEGATSLSSNPKPGYGTTITSNVTSALAAGFDIQSPAPSMKVWNANTNLYDGIPRTDIPINNPKGYMIFVRGDRTVVTSTQSPTPLTLRTTGKIYSPSNPPDSIAVAANKFQSVGNPYASTIDFTSVVASSVNIDSNYYYVWDPLFQTSNGLGGYQTISRLFGPVPGGTANYVAGESYTKIQSGQAIYLRSAGTNPGMVKFEESNKISTNTNVFRNAGANDFSSLRSFLFSIDGKLADGNLIKFDSQFSEAVDNNDALKFTNIAENFGIRKERKILAVETRPELTANDTIFYHIANLRQNEYKLLILPENLNQLSLTATLIDQYDRRRILLSLVDSNFIRFNITSNPSSYSNDRFYIVFQDARPLPVTFTSIKAYPYNKNIGVEWKVENEINMLRYKIEKSIDGIHFDEIGDTAATGNNRYFFEDIYPQSGNNFYRIKGLELNGQISYSDIAKVWVNYLSASFLISPNPVKDNNLIIQFINQFKGDYKINIHNSTGQLMGTFKATHDGLSRSYQYKLPKHFSSGVYQISVINEERNVSNLQFILEK